jgi:hypothetical protein
MGHTRVPTKPYNDIPLDCFVDQIVSNNPGNTNK